jgi:pimeloyl-ACP methyl ester carboxylesterase
MAAIVTDDGVTLHAEEAGQGEPLVFIHEFAGDHRSWESQVRFFSAAYRCVSYAARGYPPSGVPTDPAAYSQARAVADTIAVLDGLGIDRAHLVGLSMGGFTALHLVMSHPEFAAALAEHSDLGSALTMRGVQAARPSLYALTDKLAKVRVPVLVMVGDEDEGCLEPALMLKRTIPTAGLAVLPRTGHTANLEEPDVFNHAVDRFLAAVARGAWHPRDPRSVSDSTMGLR